MQKIFNNKEVKNAISLLLTVAIGLLGSSMGSWDATTDKFFKSKLIALIIVSVIFLFFLILSYVYDKKEVRLIEIKDKEISKLKENISANEKIISSYEKSNLSMATIFQKSADDINTTANNIINTENVSIDIWNFKKSCKWICEKLLEIIEELAEEGNDFAVSVFQANPIKTGRSKGITMIAHSSKYGSTPDVYETALTYRKNADFYAVKLFKKGNHEPTVLIDKNEVNEKFIYKNENAHPDYSQYVAIPIHCNGNEMLSLLQIVAFGDSKIGITKSEITEKMNKFVLPYTQLGLMTYKYEKSILNCGYIVEKMKGDNANE